MNNICHIPACHFNTIIQYFSTSGILCPVGPFIFRNSATALKLLLTVPFLVHFFQQNKTSTSLAQELRAHWQIGTYVGTPNTNTILYLHGPTYWILVVLCIPYTCSTMVQYHYPKGSERNIQDINCFYLSTSLSSPNQNPKNHLQRVIKS